jgi:predicted 3-demethylubiquinone-9 3-methyltransferase (glyoxalase superfamily)
MPNVRAITPCLWFDGQAEEAAKFYTGIFKNSKLGKITRYGSEGYEIHGQKAGTVMTVSFELEGQPFTALNGGDQFKFNEAISFEVPCKTQEELDYYWEKLGAGGDPKAQQCGWLKDRFGVSWQIVPTLLTELMSEDPETPRAQRLMREMLKQKKLDIAALKRAYEG